MTRDWFTVLIIVANAIFVGVFAWLLLW